MRRRSLLASVALTAAAPLSGCIGSTDDVTDDTATEPDDDADDGPGDDAEPTGQAALPEDCPTSMDLDIEWPLALDADSAASFVVAYEEAYVDQVVLGEPESQVEDRLIGVGYRPPPEAVDDGYLIEVSGGGAHYQPRLLIRAEPVETPDGEWVVPADDIDDEELSELLEDAAAEGHAETDIWPGSDVDHYLDTVASLSPDFDPPTGPGAAGTAHFAVDDVTVELTLETDHFHGDMGWDASYYVTENVLWRTSPADDAPRDGDLLECRNAD